MIRNWLRNFMIGRYGPDQLNILLLILAVIFGLIASITGLLVFSIISYIIIVLAFFRLLSRNFERRRRENDVFLRFWWPVRRKVKMFFEKLKARKNYRFFKCPSCKNTLRVPKNKGKIQITCPKCGERFIKKT